MNRLTALEPHGHAVSVLFSFNRDDLFSEPKNHFEFTRVVGERFDDLPVDEVQNLRALFNHRHPDFKGGKHGGILKTDDSPTDDDDFAREIGKDDLLRKF